MYQIIALYISNLNKFIYQSYLNKAGKLNFNNPPAYLDQNHKMSKFTWNSKKNENNDRHMALTQFSY